MLLIIMKKTQKSVEESRGSYPRKERTLRYLHRVQIGLKVKQLEFGLLFNVELVL